MKFLKKLLAATAATVLATGAHSSVTNGGFETGDLSGWSTFLTGGWAQAVTTVDGYLPQEGHYFLSLTAGQANNWQVVSQSFFMDAGSKLWGKAAFNWRDYSPFLDGAKVDVYDMSSGSVSHVFSADGTGKPAFTKGPWQTWSYTAPTTGYYTLILGAKNTIDGAMSSAAYFDAISPIPEPTSLAMLGLGMCAVVGAARRRKS